jgi:hypothetical protein
LTPWEAGEKNELVERGRKRKETERKGSREAGRWGGGEAAAQHRVDRWHRLGTKLERNLKGKNERHMSGGRQT